MAHDLCSAHGDRSPCLGAGSWTIAGGCRSCTPSRPSTPSRADRAPSPAPGHERPDITSSSGAPGVVIGTWFVAFIVGQLGGALIVAAAGYDLGVSEAPDPPLRSSSSAQIPLWAMFIGIPLVVAADSRDGIAALGLRARLGRRVGRARRPRAPVRARAASTCRSSSCSTSTPTARRERRASSPTGRRASPARCCSS